MTSYFFIEKRCQLFLGCIRDSSVKPAEWCTQRSKTAVVAWASSCLCCWVSVVWPGLKVTGAAYATCGSSQNLATIFYSREMSVGFLPQGVGIIPGQQGTNCSHVGQALVHSPSAH